MKQIEKYDLYKSNIEHPVITECKYLGKVKNLGDLMLTLPIEAMDHSIEVVNDGAWICLRVYNQIEQYVVVLGNIRCN